jgi:hypothetical protein
MTHVTFIHGIANKPKSEDLLGIWRRGLTRSTGALDPGASGVSSAMVYWADLLYAEPDAKLAAYESVGELELEAVKQDPAIEAVWLQPEDTVQEIWLRDLAAKLKVEENSPTGNDAQTPPEAEADGTFERVPLPWFVRRRFLKTFLRDVHHYLFDVEVTPRPGETYRVQDEIRRHFLAAQREGAKSGPPHILISHSMGTVIAYDCLKRVPDCLAVEALITIGSPLGLDEIQDKLQPGWTRPDGFPSGKVRDDWVNVFDHLDPVAGFDPFLSSDYRQGGADVILDTHEANHGAWRHDLSKYFAGPQLRAQVRRLLEL